MIQLLLGDIAPSPARNRVFRLLDIAEQMGYYIGLADGCVEPGYDDKPVALGDWNSRTQYDSETQTSRVTDDTMPRLAKLFEKLGYEIEWEDEWAFCGDCSKVFRTRPNSYSWKPHYWISDDGCICGDCVKDDPAGYLKSLSGNENSCMTFDIDLTEYGYRRHSHNYENGWHPGQDDDPKMIARQIRETEGITDFIFVLDYKGQFDTGFSVWAKKGDV